MANTGNTQQQINYGASANDGQGDPLRTAFIKTDDNFDNIWLAGPVGSNITIGNNTIQSNNTNGNIILKPNGTGMVQANASIIPNADGVRDLGSSTLAWRRAYIDELLPTDLTVSGDAVIQGNLTVQGDTIQIGNITTDTLTIQLANTAANAASANGAGITVGASDDIATILYNSTANRWNVSVGLSAVGNISAPYFSGNGSLLTGIASGYGNANVVAYANTGWAGNIRPAADVTYNLGNSDARWNNIWSNQLRGNLISGPDANSWQLDSDTDILSAPSGASWISDPVSLDEYISSATDGYLNLQTFDNTSNVATELHMEHGVVQINIYNGAPKTWEFNENGSTTFPGDVFPSANLGGSLGNSSLYWSNLWVANNTIYIGGVPLGMTAGNVLTVNGNAVLSNNSSTAVSTTGNITAGNVLTGGVVSATGNITGGNVSTGIITLTNSAKIRDTAGNAVAFGLNAGLTNQNDSAVAIGNGAGEISQGFNAVAVGYGAGANAQGSGAVSVGVGAGYITQGASTVAIGASAGYQAQAVYAVAIGLQAGQTSQAQDAIAIGRDAGKNSQGEIAVAIGHLAGNASQGNAAVAIGASAGQTTQGVHAVAIGTDSGATTQGNRAVAIGYLAGSTAQGTAAVAIGYYAGELNQGNNSIIINATDTALQQTTANTFTVAPIRNDVANVAEILFYDTASKEITYGNTINVAGNITGANLITTGNVSGNTGGFAIGYRDIPQVSFTGNATIATTDAGKHFYSTQSTDYILTIANNASQGFQTGAAITVINQGTGNITLAQGSGVTLYLTGNATSGNRTVTTFGMATLIKVATDTWFVSGAGVI